MLEIKNVSKTFNAGTINEKRALTDLSLSLNDGDFVTVIGGNGAGKSTLLNAVAGVCRSIPDLYSSTARTSPACPSTKEQSTSAVFSRIP